MKHKTLKQIIEEEKQEKAQKRADFLEKHKKELDYRKIKASDIPF